MSFKLSRSNTVAVVPSASSSPHISIFSLLEIARFTLSTPLSMSFRKHGSWRSEILGYKKEDLWNRLKSCKKFQYYEENNIEWDIDHKYPVKAFVEHGITDVKIICALDNLQPLESSINRSKGDKYRTRDFYRYLESKGIQYEQKSTNTKGKYK